MGESGGVVQRRARRFVFTKNTAFLAAPQKSPQAQKQQNAKNTADKREDVIREQGTTATAGRYTISPFFSLIGEKVNFLFFPFKKNQKSFCFEKR